MRGLVLVAAATLGVVGCHSFDEVSVCQSDPLASVQCPGNPNYCTTDQLRCNGRQIERCGSTPGSWSSAQTCDVACSEGACTSVVDIVAGEADACAILGDQSVRCWGLNTGGQLGFESIADALVPVEVPALRGARSIAIGLEHGCAVLGGEGRVVCWGSNSRGEIGDGTFQVRTDPAPVSLPEAARTVSVVDHVSCALLESGSVYCWGAGPILGSPSDVASPQALTGLDGPASHLTAAGGGMCVLVSDHVECWGSRIPGAGTGTSPIVAAAGSYRSLTASWRTVCGLSPVGRFWCWGDDSSRTLGITGTADIAHPVAATSWDGASQLTLGDSHNCGLLDSVLYCGGSDAYGQLGDGMSSALSVPQRVPGLPSVRNAVGLAGSTCALTVGGQVYCWGGNADGSIGDGSRTDRRIPTLVAF